MTMKRAAVDGAYYEKTKYGTTWWSAPQGKDPFTNRFLTGYVTPDRRHQDTERILRSADRTVGYVRRDVVVASGQGTVHEAHLRHPLPAVLQEWVEGVQAQRKDGVIVTKKDKAKKAPPKVETPKRTRGPRSLTDIVRKKLDGASEPVKYGEITAYARKEWEKDGRTPSKTFAGQVWHACQTVGNVPKGLRGVYVLKPPEKEAPKKKGGKKDAPAEVVKKPRAKKATPATPASEPATPTVSA